MLPCMIKVDQGPEFLKLMFGSEFKVFFGDEVCIEVGWPFGEDFSPVFGHTGVGNEGGGLRL